MSINIFNAALQGWHFEPQRQPDATVHAAMLKLAHVQKLMEPYSDGTEDLRKVVLLEAAKCCNIASVFLLSAAKTIQEREDPESPERAVGT